MFALQAAASIAPLSQIIRQSWSHDSPSSKNVFSICNIHLRRFSWNLWTVIENKNNIMRLMIIVSKNMTCLNNINLRLIIPLVSILPPPPSRNVIWYYFKGEIIQILCNYSRNISSFYTANWWRPTKLEILKCILGITK